ncbi:MAG TPA: peptidoglycan-associated lipoprotein Pal [Caulobacteraceae bacterium]|nr:peptidoglycan-associated lipoprotein Pal [Caulobacteraceae bacterium]
MIQQSTTFARLALASLAALLVAACASHKPPPPQAPTPPPAAEQPPPTAQYESPPAPTGPIPGSQQDFVVNVGELVYFDFDQSDIRADAQPILSAQAAWLQRYPAVKVRIEGNCDERGTREYNFALGARRAYAVRQFLIAHGVDGARITTISYGKERPIDPGNDEQAWARNRNARTAITEGAR